MKIIIRAVFFAFEVLAKCCITLLFGVFLLPMIPVEILYKWSHSDPNACEFLQFNLKDAFLDTALLNIIDEVWFSYE